MMQTTVSGVDPVARLDVGRRLGARASGRRCRRSASGSPRCRAAGPRGRRAPRRGAAAAAAARLRRASGRRRRRGRSTERRRAGLLEADVRPLLLDLELDEVVLVHQLDELLELGDVHRDLVPAGSGRRTLRCDLRGPVKASRGRPPWGYRRARARSARRDADAATPSTRSAIWTAFSAAPLRSWSPVQPEVERRRRGPGRGGCGRRARRRRPRRRAASGSASRPGRRRRARPAPSASHARASLGRRPGARTRRSPPRCARGARGRGRRSRRRAGRAAEDAPRLLHHLPLLGREAAVARRPARRGSRSRRSGTRVDVASSAACPARSSSIWRASSSRPLRARARDGLVGRHDDAADRRAPRSAARAR